METMSINTPIWNAELRIKFIILEVNFYMRLGIQTMLKNNRDGRS